MDSFQCTESNTGPILDIVWAGLNVIGALVVAGDRNAYENPDAAIAGGIAWGAISGTAAAVGFSKSKKCRAAKQDLAERQAHAIVVPLPLDTTAQAAVVAVVVSSPSDTLKVGERVQLFASAHGSSGGTVPVQTFYWTSSNDAIASVSEAGLVAATAPGTVVIAARAGAVVGTARMVVVTP